MYKNTASLKMKTIMISYNAHNEILYVVLITVDKGMQNSMTCSNHSQTINC